MTVYTRPDGQVFARLPPDCARPIGPPRCTCPYCRSHPGREPLWDTLNVTDPAFTGLYPWGFTVHYPDLELDLSGRGGPPSPEQVKAFDLYCRWFRRKHHPSPDTHPCG